MTKMAPSIKEEVKTRLTELISKYKLNQKLVNLDDSSEETVRAWLNEFLSIFGWNVQDTTQVLQGQALNKNEKGRLASIESTHSIPDYTLRNGSITKTFLDAKALDVNIFTNKRVAFQVRSYGWSAQTPCAFASNFEQFVIYDCSFIPNPEQDANYGTIQLSISQYIDKFDILFDHLWINNVYNNNLLELYDIQRVEGNQKLDGNFTELLSNFRLTLARHLVKNNDKLIKSDNSLNYFVQIILDRIIFVRICESKGLEKQGKLKEYINSSDGFWKSFKNSCYFEYYNHYDGAMFERNENFQALNIDDEIIIDFIEKLYYPYPYRFDVMPIKVIATIYDEFLEKHLQIKLNKTVVLVSQHNDRSSGAVSTPEHIVDMICKRTINLSNISDVKSLLNIRLLDLCCGSGIFLISAYELLQEKLLSLLILDETNEYKSYWISDGVKPFLTIKGKRVLFSSCLYGVDYDEAAVEVAKMSLALKVIDGYSQEILIQSGLFGNKILQDVAKNIICGNSLVESDISININEILEIKPYNIKKDDFADVFNKFGGFDYIIGNPPYVETKYFKDALPKMHEYIKTHYQSYEGKADLSVIFIERGLSLLNPKGKLGFIVQRRWFKSQYGMPIRKLITLGNYLHTLIDFQATDIFPRKITYVSILVLDKGGNDNYNFEYSYNSNTATEIRSLFENSDNDGLYPEYQKEVIPKWISTNPEDIWSYESYKIIGLKLALKNKFGTLANYPNLHVKDGIQALWKKYYHIIDYNINSGIICGKNRAGEIISIEVDATRAVLYNREFYPFMDVTPTAYTIFPYRKDGVTRISMSEISKEFPLLYNYLISHKSLIQENIECRPGDEFWHTFTREHNQQLYFINKIIVPMTAKDTIATYISDKGLYMDNANVWFIIIDNASEILMKAITCVINSTIFSVLAKSGANPQSNGYYKFNRQFLDPVPFPSVSITDNNPDVIRLSELYNDIKDLEEKWIQSLPNLKSSIESVIDSKWKELDTICENLYEITDNEKKIINSIGRTVTRTKLLSGAE